MALNIPLDLLTQQAPTPEVVDALVANTTDPIHARLPMPAGPGPNMVRKALEKATPVPFVVSVINSTTDVELLAKLLTNSRKTVREAAADKLAELDAYQVLVEHSTRYLGRAASESSDPELLAGLLEEHGTAVAHQVLLNSKAPAALKRHAATLTYGSDRERFLQELSFRSLATVEELWELAELRDFGDLTGFADVPEQDVAALLATATPPGAVFGAIIGERLVSGAPVSELIGSADRNNLIRAAKVVFADGAQSSTFKLKGFVPLLEALPDGTDFTAFTYGKPLYSFHAQDPDAILALAQHPVPEVCAWARNFRPGPGRNRWAAWKFFLRDNATTAEIVGQLLEAIKAGDAAAHDEELWALVTERLGTLSQGVGKLLERCPVKLADRSLANLLYNSEEVVIHRWFKSGTDMPNGYRDTVAALVLSRPFRRGVAGALRQLGHAHLDRVADHLAAYHEDLIRSPASGQWLARRLAIGLGDDPAAWELALALAPEWDGPISELVSVARAAVAT